MLSKMLQTKIQPVPIEVARTLVFVMYTVSEKITTVYIFVTPANNVRS